MFILKVVYLLYITLIIVEMTFGVSLFIMCAFALIVHLVLNNAVHNDFNEFVEEDFKIKNQKLKSNQLIANMLISKLGGATKIVNFAFKNFVVINENKSLLIINEHTYNFKDIIKYEIMDNSKIVYSPTTSVTKTSSGSMLGRAILGGVISGGVGAIIGGSTGTKITSTTGCESSTEHQFTIIVTVNNLSHPIEKIILGNQQECVIAISSIFEIIINQNVTSNIVKDEIANDVSFIPYSDYNLWNKDKLNEVLKPLKVRGNSKQMSEIIFNHSSMNPEEAKQLYNSL